MEIPKCPGPCSFDKFLELTKWLIPDDWEKECQTLTPDYNTLLFWNFQEFLFCTYTAWNIITKYVIMWTINVKSKKEILEM